MKTYVEYTIQSGQKFVIPNQGQIQKENDSFSIDNNKTIKSWNTERDGSGTSYSVNDEISPSENITLYAQWDQPNLIMQTTDQNIVGIYEDIPSNKVSYVADGQVQSPYSSHEELKNKDNLKSVTIVKDAEEIGEFGFKDCKSLEDITGDDIKIVGDNGLYGCYSLKSANFQDMIRINTRQYYGCSSIVSVYGDNISSVGQEAFENCVNLSSIYVPNLISAEAWCFSYCENLKYVDMSNIKWFSRSGVFLEDEKLSSIRISNTNPNYEALNDNMSRVTDGNVIIGHGSTKDVVWVSPCRKTNLDFSGFNVSCVASYAFRKSEISNITGLGNVKECGFASFAQCKNISSIYLPSYEGYMDKWAGGQYGSYECIFEWCENLLSVYIPKVKIVGRLMFNSCKKLTDIDMSEIDNVPLVAWSSSFTQEEQLRSVFRDCQNKVKIHLKNSDVMQKFKTTSPWSLIWDGANAIVEYVI